MKLFPVAGLKTSHNNNNNKLLNSLRKYNNFPLIIGFVKLHKCLSKGSSTLTLDHYNDIDLLTFNYLSS